MKIRRGDIIEIAMSKNDFDFNSFDIIQNIFRIYIEGRLGADNAIPLQKKSLKYDINGYFNHPEKEGRYIDIILYNDVNLKSIVLHYFYLNDITDYKLFSEYYPRKNG